MLIAKKHVETKIEGDYEISKKHILKIKELEWKEFDDIVIDAPEFEDPEDAYIHGVIIDMNDDIVWISLNPFICWIDDYIENNHSEDEEDVYHDIDKLKKLRSKIEKYVEYDVYPPSSSNIPKVEEK